MNILFLMNGAPESFRLFKELACRFQNDGDKVVTAVDCLYSKDLNKLDSNSMEVRVFTDYWKNDENIHEEAAEKYKRDPIYSTLLSDFERADEFGFLRKRHRGFYDSLLSNLIGFFESIVKQENIDAIVYENVSNGFANVAWMVANRCGVRYCGLYPSRLPGRFEIVDDPLRECEIYRGTFLKLRQHELMKSQSLLAWVEDYLSNLDQTIPDYMFFTDFVGLKLFPKYFNFAKLKKYSFILRRRYSDESRAFQVGNPVMLLVNLFFRSFKRRFRAKKCMSYFSEPNLSDRYFLYPLQYHPESSTSVKAPSFINEYEIIRAIVFSLPYGTKLYIKDHPSMFALQSVDFYQRLSLLPNTVLIAPSANTKSLIKSSMAVLTLTSTVGFEALLYGKKVLMFGSDSYEHHPNVVKVNDISLLHEILVQELYSPTTVDRSITIDFIASYYMCTYSGVINFFLSGEKTKTLAELVYPQVRNFLLHGRSIDAYN